ncbi:MAG: hypothetical protein JJ979_02520 [Roseibium sp.]|nr:hypothetical protein [Roseibium sp.]
MSNHHITVSERMAMFEQSYGNNFDALKYFHDLIHACGQFFENIFEADDANHGMKLMLRHIAQTEVETDDWEELIEDPALLYSKSPMAPLIHELSAYAQFGIVLDASIDEPARKAKLKEQVEQLNKLHRFAQPFMREKEDDDLKRLVDHVNGRWAIDNKQPVHPRGLAALSNLKVQTVANAISSQKSMLRLEKGHLPYSAALDWLESKKGYWQSVWQDQSTEDSTEAPIEEDDSPYILLPFARDGSAFHPGLKINGVYRIGVDYGYEPFTDFDKALERLLQMPKPCWIRKNPNGFLVRIALKSWRRVRSDKVKYL